MIQLDDLQKVWGTQRCCDSPLKLIGVRGALDAGFVNREDIYDDVIFAVNAKTGTFTAWLASVDPSTPLIQNPINPAGAAQLVPGVHLFRKGIHKENPKWPCLVQAEDFTVYRLAADGEVKGQESGDFGIHLHSGGMGEGTGRFSAGCQIIHNGDGYFQDPTWSAFIQPLYAAMQAGGIREVPYLLVDASEAKLDVGTVVFSNPYVP